MRRSISTKPLLLAKASRCVSTALVQTKRMCRLVREVVSSPNLVNGLDHGWLNLKRADWVILYVDLVTNVSACRIYPR